MSGWVPTNKIVWDIYEEPGYYMAFAFINDGLQKTIVGTNRPLFDIRVRLWNVWLLWKSRNA